MLKTPTSLTYMNTKNPHGWLSPKAQEKINYNLYECNQSLPHFGFANWNEWFLRTFNKGQRPMFAGMPSNAPPEDVIINACEATPIEAPIQPTRRVKASAPFWLKGNLYSLVDMFGNYGL